MDIRLPLADGARLSLSGIDYTIAEFLGKGSNAFCYKARYEDSHIKDKFHSVLIKELFPLEENGLIQRDSNGSAVIIGDEARPFFELHKLSFLRGSSIGIDLNEYRPDKSMQLINTCEANGTLYCIIGVSGGYPFSEAPCNSLKDAVERVIGVLHALKPFHEKNLLHLDISPDNILLLPKEEGSSEQRALLIDYNSVFSAGEISGGGMYFSIKKPFTAPEIILGDIPSVNFGTDLYSVAAVFAKLINPAFTGNPAQIKPSLDMFGGVPQTAIHKAVSIIRKGISLSSKRRYLTIDELQSELAELTRRIDCAGVTRPALWEASAAAFKAEVAAKPQYNYIKDSAIPSQVTMGSVSANTLITGGGGMGKTTAMLRIWEEGVERYNPSLPIPLYIKLNDYSSDRNIRMRCLDRLRFTSETTTVADALKALGNVFNEDNAVVLLLDGYNEAAEAQRAALNAEIAELCGYKGVTVVVSSREQAKEHIGFRRLSLTPLSQEFVKGYLNANELLYPENTAMAELLANPMMLNIYAKLMHGVSEHSEVYNEATLIEAYIKYVVSKAKRRTLADFAVNTLLPLIAKAMEKSGEHVISPAAALRISERVYGELKGRHFRKVFTEYIGASRELLAESSNPDEWFEVVISEVLGSELALLIKTENGSYSFSHQLFRDYFAVLGQNVSKRLQKVVIRRAKPRVMGAAAVLLLACVCVFGFMQFTNKQIFPSKPEEINAVNNAINGLAIAMANMDTMLYDGDWEIDYMKRPPLSGDWSEFMSEREKKVTRSEQYNILKSPEIEMYISLINIPGSTIPQESYKELLEASGAFLEEREVIIDGIFNKMMINDNPYVMQDIFNNYKVWSDNRAKEFVLLLHHAIGSLPNEYRMKLLGMPNLNSSLKEQLLDTNWEPSGFEAQKEQIHEIDFYTLGAFKKEGVLSDE